MSIFWTLDIPRPPDITSFLLWQHRVCTSPPPAVLTPDPPRKGGPCPSCLSLTAPKSSPRARRRPQLRPAPTPRPLSRHRNATRELKNQLLRPLPVPTGDGRKPSCDLGSDLRPPNVLAHARSALSLSRPNTLPARPVGRNEGPACGFPAQAGSRRPRGAGFAGPSGATTLSPPEWTSCYGRHWPLQLHPTEGWVPGARPATQVARSARSLLETSIPLQTHTRQARGQHAHILTPPCRARHH